MEKLLVQGMTIEDRKRDVRHVGLIRIVNRMFDDRASLELIAEEYANATAKAYVLTLNSAPIVHAPPVSTAHQNIKHKITAMNPYSKSQISLFEKSLTL